MTPDERQALTLARHRRALDAGEVWTSTARDILRAANDAALAELARMHPVYGALFRNYAMRDWMRATEVDECGTRWVR